MYFNTVTSEPLIVIKLTDEKSDVSCGVVFSILDYYSKCVGFISRHNEKLLSFLLLLIPNLIKKKKYSTYIFQFINCCI